MADVEPIQKKKSVDIVLTCIAYLVAFIVPFAGFPLFIIAVIIGRGKPGKMGIVFLFLGLLHILIIIIGDPIFKSPREKAMFYLCLESLTGIKVAQEMYITDNKEYTGELDRLAVYMIAGCTDKDGKDCPGRVRNLLDRNCAGWELSAIRMEGKYDNYQLKGTSMDRTKCRICVTPSGYWPTSYTEICMKGKGQKAVCP